MAKKSQDWAAEAAQIEVQVPADLRQLMKFNSTGNRNIQP